MHLIYFLGRFHVLMLHLPIGIIVVLFVLEWVSRKERYRYLQNAAPFLWGALSITALATVLLGYMHFSEGGFSGPSGTQHRWFGTSFALLATGVAFLRTSSFADAYKPLFFPASAVLLVLVSITGHLGGNLTHGSTFLIEYAPQPLRSLFGMAPRRVVTNLADADPFEDVVQPMLRQRCMSCHGPDKQENDLDMSTYAKLMHGAEDGKVIVPRDPGQSELLRRITIDPNDDDYMPAEGKTPLTARQVDIIRWWVEAGAPNGTTLGAIDVPADVKGKIAAELGLNP